MVDILGSALFSDQYLAKPKPPKNRLLPEGHDPLAAVMAHMGDNGQLTLDFGLTYAILQPSQQHLDQANQIRDYYLDVYTTMKLMGQELSEYKLTVIKALAERGRIREDYVGIYCRLPDFYREDIFLDDIDAQALAANSQHTPKVGDQVTLRAHGWYTKNQAATKFNGKYHNMYASDQTGLVYGLHSSLTTNIMPLLQAAQEFTVCIRRMHMTKMPRADRSGRLVRIQALDILSVEQ